MKKQLLILLLVPAGGAAFLSLTAPAGESKADKKMASAETRYLPLGDSYTIGTGAPPGHSWPQQLCDHLTKEGVNIRLIGNPARNGFTTQNLIDYELPVLKRSNANFVSLLIGVNDWVQGVDKVTYEKNLEQIITAIQAHLGADKHRVLLVTIPDFGLTRSGKNYSGTRDISTGIAGFNAIIAEKGKKYGLPVADIFTISKNVEDDPSLVGKDGLHPSAKGYSEWEREIYNEAKKLLKK